MACSIDAKHNSKIHKWIISKESMDQLYPLLYEDREIAGKFQLKCSEKKTSHEVSFVNGDKDSVEAPKAIINYHTHPVSCYLGEGTVWGWPSGEDMRESVLFGMKGSVVHVVPTVEGTYVCQVNPCILENLIHLEDVIKENPMPKKMSQYLKKYKYKEADFMRGLIVLCIEVCFRSTHVFRTFDFNNNYSVSARDFIEYCNSFQLKNMFSDEYISGCGSLQCNNIWVFEEKLHKKVSFSKYVDDYENDAKVYICNNHGKADYSKIKLKTAIKHGFINYMKKLKLGSHCKYPNKLWSEKWFLLSLSENNVLIDGHTINYNSPKLTTKDRGLFLNNASKQIYNNPELRNSLITLIKEPVFYFFDMRGSCTYKNVKENLSRKSDKNSIKSNKLIVFGSEQCSFCRKLVPKLSKDYSLEIRYYDTIKEAIAKANRFSKTKDVETIPAVFEKSSKNLLHF